MRNKVEIAGAAIEDAARELFATQGFAGTSMRDLARTAGVSAANIYNYAESKEELLWRVSTSLMHRLLAGADTALATSTCPAAQLDAFVRAHVTYHALNARPIRMGQQELKHLTTRHRREVTTLRNTYEALVRDVIARGGQLGFFDQYLERYAAFSILESGYGVGVWFRPSGGLTVEQLSAVYATLALRMLAFDDATHRITCPDPGRCHTTLEVHPLASETGAGANAE